MKSGRRSRTFFFSCLALCCLSSFSLWGQEESSPDSSNGYWITEEELTRLEDILTTQEKTLKRQAKELELAASQLSEADNLVNQQSVTIARLKTSFVRLEREVRVRRVVNWVLAGTTGILAIIVALQ